MLLRHGESVWNREDRFTGWCDVPLTSEGELEAVEAGRVLATRGIDFDIAYTSDLRRASQTCALCLAAAHDERKQRGGVKSGRGGSGIGSPVGRTRVVRSWHLNERHYGNLQGLKKDDHMLMKKYGKSDIFEWRRSYDGRPPPIDAGHPFWQPPPAPQTESLRDCQKRVELYYMEEILPRLELGAKVLVVAHANTIRALVKVVDAISDADIRDLRIPNSVPLLYRLRRVKRGGSRGDPLAGLHMPGNLEPAGESDEWGFQGEYLTSWQRADTLLAVERSQRRVLQAIFRAMDEEGRGFITAAQFQKWAMTTAGCKIQPYGYRRNIATAGNRPDDSSPLTSASVGISAVHQADPGNITSGYGCRAWRSSAIDLAASSRKEPASTVSAGMTSSISSTDTVGSDDCLVATGVPPDPLEYKMNQKTLHFFRKHGVNDPHVEISFEYFMALSAVGRTFFTSSLHIFTLCCANIPSLRRFAICLGRRNFGTAVIISATLEHNGELHGLGS